MTRCRLMGGTVAMLLATGAQAHMPFLLPGKFDIGRRTHVAVQSGFGEDAFAAEIAMRDAPFHMIGPDGTRQEVGTPAYLRDLSVFEADLPTDGTYRLSTGQRGGRKGRMYEVDGRWMMRGEGGAIPSGAREVEVQSMTLAEAYVTRGKASTTALKPTGRALEVEAISHPSDVTAGSGVRFRLLFDGQPLAGETVALYRAAGQYDGRKLVAEVRSDGDGAFTLTPADAGLYLLLVRHRGAAPAGSETPFRSYTYTLAFDAA